MFIFLDLFAVENQFLMRFTFFVVYTDVFVNIHISVFLKT